MQRRSFPTVSILLGTGAKTALPGDPFRLAFIRLSRVLWLSVLVVMLGGLLEPEAAAQTVSFGAKTDFGTGARPKSVAVGDFNGDGTLDLAVANQADSLAGSGKRSGTVSILLGTGPGSFVAKTELQDFKGTSSVAVGDFNGDGKLDLAVGSATVSILLGTGTGSFGAKTDFGFGGSSVVVGDFNGDGKLDLAVANDLSDFVSILLGTGTGSFGAKTDFDTGSGASSVAVGDFNGDGELDLATANFFGNTVSILLGTGTGSFGAKTDFGTGSNPASVAVGDFNGDGKLDLATANGDPSGFFSDTVGQTVSILLGTGTGSFGAKTDFGTGTSPQSVAVGDFDGDGKLDLAVANFDSSTVSILLGTGTGSFGARTDFGTGAGPVSVAVGDFNGDGKLDLAVANLGSIFVNDPGPKTVSILLNTGPTGPCASANPIDCTDFFVRQHYRDFLNREPDPGGFNGWLSLLNGCPPNQGGLGSDPACDRVQVSSGFFRSTEFGERGYWLYRYYHAVLGRRPQFTEFVPDMRRLSGFLTPAEQDAARGAFINEFMQRPEFLNLYVGLTAPANAPQFIARLELTAGVTLPETIPPTQPGQPPQFGRTELIQKMQSGELSPGQTLRAFIEQKVVFDAFFYRAFVAMQYFGYLRRDPEPAGYDDWVDVLTNGRGSIRPGDYRYLIFGFVYSVEYRRRFGP